MQATHIIRLHTTQPTVYTLSHCLAWLRFEMVTVKVQRCPILDYFMAYFLEHPEGNANC